MEKENLEELFESLEGKFDMEEPNLGHRERFLEKLNSKNDLASIHKRRKSLWKPLSIAASLVILLTIGLSMYHFTPSVEEQVAEISPEVSQMEVYFASLIEEQIKQLEGENTPEAKKLIEDTMEQLKRLETDYTKLEQELLAGGNSKFLLSAMITNFQTRIDLLQDVMNKIETIKTLKSYNDENFTI